ncbi:hypothetical protein ACGFNU_15895 [Spirillospora sp. NPDC048911]|uniref:hypothetical protein n=1 Tax=Spirillospora sp. NPDC048911 TaxID=3364527 RepID=UPI003723F1A4
MPVCNVGRISEIRTILTEYAWATGRTSTGVGARFRRFHRRFGMKSGKKAAPATAHTVIVIIWHVLRDPQVREELDRLSDQKLIDRCADLPYKSDWRRREGSVASWASCQVH